MFTIKVANKMKAKIHVYQIIEVYFTIIIEIKENGSKRLEIEKK